MMIVLLIGFLFSLGLALVGPPRLSAALCSAGWAVAAIVWLEYRVLHAKLRNRD